MQHDLITSESASRTGGRNLVRIERSGTHAPIEPSDGWVGIASKVIGRSRELSPSPIAFGNQTVSLNFRDSRLCVPASQQVCLYRVQSFAS